MAAAAAGAVVLFLVPVVPVSVALLVPLACVAVELVLLVVLLVPLASVDVELLLSVVLLLVPIVPISVTMLVPLLDVAVELLQPVVLLVPIGGVDVELLLSVVLLLVLVVRGGGRDDELGGRGGALARCCGQAPGAGGGLLGLLVPVALADESLRVPATVLPSVKRVVPSVLLRYAVLAALRVSPLDPGLVLLEPGVLLGVVVLDSTVLLSVVPFVLGVLLR